MLIETANYVIERSLEFTTALSQHLSITFISLGISIILGLLFGIITTRIKWLEKITLTLGNLGRTIPSLAVLALALPFLGIGTPPTILALVFIGTLPILINTNVGISQVDEAIVESARGMGMNDFQVLTRVEIPIATAVIMAGIRTSAVLVVASATLAAFIGGGGLGDLILRGHALNMDHILLAGALPATLLAFYFEDMFGRLESWVTPKGLKIGQRGAQGGSDTFLGFLSSVLLMPLVFGALLPWESYSDAEGSTVILTGMHSEYINIGLTLLVLGVILVMRPRRGRLSENKITSFVILAIAGITILLAVISLITTLSTVAAGHALRSGVYLQTGAAIAIAVVTIIEVVGDLAKRPSEEITAELAASPGD
jgi:osmoprotectant transport system permease protein